MAEEWDDFFFFGKLEMSDFLLQCNQFNMPENKGLN